MQPAPVRDRLDDGHVKVVAIGNDSICFTLLLRPLADTAKYIYTGLLSIAYETILVFIFTVSSFV